MDSVWQTAALEFADEPRQTLREDGEFVLYRGLVGAGTRTTQSRSRRS